MNFLEIAKKANIYSGLQGEVDSAVSLTGVQKTLVEFINSAYTEIQLMRNNWLWMQAYTSTFQWGDQSTSVINSDVNRYNALYNSLDNPMSYIEYIDWVTGRAPTVPVSIPTSFTIIPDTNAVIVCPVLATVTISYSAVINPETLTTNTQVPKMPERYHLILAYKAAADMSAMLGNADIFNLNTTKYDMMLTQLMRNQNAPLTIRQRSLV